MTGSLSKIKLGGLATTGSRNSAFPLEPKLTLPGELAASSKYELPRSVCIR